MEMPGKCEGPKWFGRDGANTKCGGTSRTPSRKVVGLLSMFVVTSIKARVVSVACCAILGAELGNMVIVFPPTHPRPWEAPLDSRHSTASSMKE